MRSLTYDRPRRRLQVHERVLAADERRAASRHRDLDESLHGDDRALGVPTRGGALQGF
jgi:hypothetical protein